MERSLKRNFEAPTKTPSEDAQRRWRGVNKLDVYCLGQFRMVPDLDMRSHAESKR